MNVKIKETQKAKKVHDDKKVQNFGIKSELKAGLDYCCPGPAPFACHPWLPSNCQPNSWGDCCCPIADT